MQAFSSCREQRLLSVVHRLLILVTSLAPENRLRAVGSVVWPALVALWHVGSSRSSDGTLVCCTGK